MSTEEPVGEGEEGTNPKAGKENYVATSPSLLQRARARDREAWDRLFYLYRPLILHWCGHWGVRREDAEDVIQEVFREVAGSLDQFRGGPRAGVFRAWLRSITRNRIRMHFRRAGKQEHAVGGSVAQMCLEQVADQPPADEDEPAEQITSLYSRGPGTGARRRLRGAHLEDVLANGRRREAACRGRRRDRGQRRLRPAGQVRRAAPTQGRTRRTHQLNLLSLPLLPIGRRHGPANRSANQPAIFLSHACIYSRAEPIAPSRHSPDSGSFLSARKGDPAVAAKSHGPALSLLIVTGNAGRRPRARRSALFLNLSGKGSCSCRFQPGFVLSWAGRRESRRVGKQQGASAGRGRAWKPVRGTCGWNFSKIGSLRRCS